MIKTVNDIMEAGSCDGYPQERVEELVGDGINEDQLVSLVDKLYITHRDIIWAISEVWLADYAPRIAWKYECVERALYRERNTGREPDPRSWKALETLRDSIYGEVPLAELVTVWKKASDAADDIENTYPAWNASPEIWAATSVVRATWDAINAYANNPFPAEDNDYQSRNAPGAAAMSAGSQLLVRAEYDWQIQRALFYIKKG